tara:strand:+ start:234 stop:626 length:393 start_codon:yes stop_codon:yes gene_type:complete
MAKDTINTETKANALEQKELFKADGRGKGATKEGFKIQCWPKGNNEAFIANAMSGLGIGFVERAITQTLSIDARSAFVKGVDLATWKPNADGTAASGDGYATLRRDLRKAGVPEGEVENIVELAKSKAGS